MNEIKLLVATGLYPPDIGGPATYSHMLEEKLHIHGVNVTVVPFGEVRHLPKIIRHVAYAWRLLKASKGAHIVYALDPISVGIPAYVISCITRKPLLIRLGGDYAWEQGQQRFGLTATLDEYTQHPHNASLPVRFLAWVQSFIVKRARIVIAPSEYLKSIITTWGVEPSRVRVIYSALFPLEISADKSTLREQLSYEGTVISTVGRLVPWKGFSELIDVVSQLQKVIPDINLVIIGDGPLHNDLQKKISSLSLEKHIRLVGKLGKEALGAAIKASDLFVLNTSYEGLSHQLLEVMELGVPIITTHVGGNPELITDGVSGMLVPIHDNETLLKTIKYLLENEQLRVRLIQNAKVRTIDFNQDVVVKQLATILKNEIIVN